MRKNKGLLATHKANKAKAKRQQTWNTFGNNVQTVGTGVGLIATLVGGFAAFINHIDSSKSVREINKTDALVALTMDSLTAEKGAKSRSHRRQARNTRKQAEKALEALAARRADAEAEYAKAVHAGVLLHRSVPQPTPIWWPEVQS